jgi:hypothetical protein
MLPVHLPRLGVKAPRHHGELLAHPPLDAVASLRQDNFARLAGGALLGRPLADLRDLARREILAGAQDYLAAGGEPVPEFSTSTWFVGGHQPELFHPGVWVKNFILHSLARRHGALPLNLVVDNDVAKSASLRVPAGDRVVSVPFDAPGGEVPFEERHVKDESVYRTLAERVATLTRDWPFRPWLHDLWPAAPRPTPLLGERIVRVRRALERSMGLTPLEAPLSAVCRTEAFAWFACALLADLPRFVESYNGAVHDYRRRHDLKSKNHPVPDLARRGDSLEAPFWTWRADSPRRQRLFAARDAKGLQLFEGEVPLARLGGDPPAWVDQWRTLERRGIKIRTRALTTTLFSRLLLADLFVHGIGGGKYDEVTDAILRRHFEREPPHFLIVTATLLLPFPRVTGLDQRWHDVNHEVRDLWYNPQRHLGGVADAPALIARKESALTMPQRTHEERVGRFHALQQATEDLRPLIADRWEKRQGDRHEVETQRRRDAILAARDYSYCLYPEKMLRAFLADESRWRVVTATAERETLPPWADR